MLGEKWTKRCIPIKPIKEYYQFKTDYPSSKNWISKGAVTSVKQTMNGCKDGWAFSAAAAVEAAYEITTGTLETFSVQQLIDCSTSFGNRGCDGGLVKNAFEYIKKYPL